MASGKTLKNFSVATRPKPKLKLPTTAFEKAEQQMRVLKKDSAAKPAEAAVAGDAVDGSQRLESSKAAAFWCTSSSGFRYQEDD